MLAQTSSPQARVPFLDKEVLEVTMNLDPKEKMIDMVRSLAPDSYVLSALFAAYGSTQRVAEGSVSWQSRGVKSFESAKTIECPRRCASQRS